MSNFVVSRILIDWGSSYDIMYAELFKMLRLKNKIYHHARVPTYTILIAQLLALGNTSN